MISGFYNPLSQFSSFFHAVFRHCLSIFIGGLEKPKPPMIFSLFSFGSRKNFIGKLSDLFQNPHRLLCADTVVANHNMSRPIHEILYDMTRCRRLSHRDHPLVQDIPFSGCPMPFDRCDFLRHSSANRGRFLTFMEGTLLHYFQNFLLGFLKFTKRELCLHIYLYFSFVSL